MRSRVFLLAVVIASVGAAPAWLACSSTPAPGFTSDDAGSVDDVTLDVVHHVDAAPDVARDAADAAPPPPEAGLADTAPVIVGNCEPVQGPACDLVRQDCEPGQECLTAPLADGGITTGCTNTTSSEHLGRGHGCCPFAEGQSGQKQCDPGLECIGDPSSPCVTDGGPPTGRCTPHCCGGDAGDDFLCGSADPEGYAGHCDTVIVDGNDPPNDLFFACSYNEVCKPFGLKPCPTGFSCIIKDSTGSAGCDTTYNPTGGPPPTEGQPCEALNGCADGLECLNQSDGGGGCFMMCLTPGSNPPFDAGALTGGPLHGGCIAGETCKVKIQDFPPWISFCN